ncbi:hypothetical protein PR048_017519 [Dryococelus australis]|uniref:Uncharacterized protein n=1 Tax=Dryococelus australis TaxID=614101 RepID=A0ABQ9HA12_9NEOP|nr:hypothetical protein PR048_017519 [Dryococelus australis]
MPLVGEFSWGSPVSSALSFRRCSILASLHLHRLSRPCYSTTGGGEVVIVVIPNFGSFSNPTKANRVQSPAASTDFRKWESCRLMPLVGGFSRGFPVSPTPSFRRRSIFTSITLIGFQDFAVKSHPNLFTLSDPTLLE